MARRRLTLSVAVVALAVAPSLASAAAISSISWTVTGGTFGGELNLSSGPITGGTVVYTPPGGTIATPASTVFGGSLFLSLTGPSGSFTASGPNPALQVTIGPTVAVVHYANLLAPILSAGVTVSASWFVGFHLNRQGPGNGFAYGINFPITTTGDDANDVWDHRFQVGSEVRVPVPEPTTGTLLGLGTLAAIGFAGSGGRAFGRRRR